MEAPPAKNRDQQPHHKGRKKQKHDKPKKPAKTRNDDGDGDDVPEAIQTVSKEMMEETSYYITPDGSHLCTTSELRSRRSSACETVLLHLSRVCKREVVWEGVGGYPHERL